MARRSIVWVKEDPPGAEFADVRIGRDRLSASGHAIGSKPTGYRADYWLFTGKGFVTSDMTVPARGEGWGRRLDLSRSRSGRWRLKTTRRGPVDLPPAGGDMALVQGAVDSDLAASPLTNPTP